MAGPHVKGNGRCAAPGPAGPARFLHARLAPGAMAKSPIPAPGTCRGTSDGLGILVGAPRDLRNAPGPTRSRPSLDRHLLRPRARNGPDELVDDPRGTIRTCPHHS